MIYDIFIYCIRVCEFLSERLTWVKNKNIGIFFGRGGEERPNMCINIQIWHDKNDLRCNKGCKPAAVDERFEGQRNINDFKKAFRRNPFGLILLKRATYICCKCLNLHCSSRYFTLKYITIFRPNHQQNGNLINNVVSEKGRVKWFKLGGDVPDPSWQAGEVWALGDHKYFILNVLVCLKSEMWRLYPAGLSQES